MFDRTGRAHHAACIRHGVTPVTGAPRQDFARPVRPWEPRDCAGCGTPISRADHPEAVPAFGTWWHAECRIRGAR